MKKILFLLLLFQSVMLLPQDKTDSLQLLLESATDTAKIRLLKDLCWENRYSNPSDALKYGLQALSLVNDLESFELEANINNYLGIIQRNVRDHATALEYFMTALRLAEKNHTMADMAYANNNIGDIYNLEGNYNRE